MTYRSSPAQLANLRPPQPKGEQARSQLLGFRVTKRNKEILSERCGDMTTADLLEEFCEILDKKDLTFRQALNLLKN